MKLQPTRKSQKGRYGRKGQTVYLHTGIWHDKETGRIHISCPKEKRFHSTVSDDKNSKRFHPNLYKKLKEILIREGRW
jgi:hypothetical protein